MLVHRATVAKVQDVLRSHIKPSEIAKNLEGILSRDDIDDVLRCEAGHTYNYSTAADLLLYKLMHLKDPGWYEQLEEVLEDSSDLLSQVLSEAYNEVLQHPAFSQEKGDFTIYEIENEGIITISLTQIIQYYVQMNKCSYYATC